MEQQRVNCLPNWLFSLVVVKMKKKTDELGAASYVNDALTCSSLDITSPKEIPHGSQSGSDEFICKLIEEEEEE